MKRAWIAVLALAISWGASGCCCYRHAGCADAIGCDGCGGGAWGGGACGGGMCDGGMCGSGCDSCGDFGCGGGVGCRGGRRCGGRGCGFLHRIFWGGCLGCGAPYFGDWYENRTCCDLCDQCGNWTGAQTHRATGGVYNAGFGEFEDGQEIIEGEIPMHASRPKRTTTRTTTTTQRQPTLAPPKQR